VSVHDVDGLNAGYARALLDEYLENPEAVPSEWRALFESGDSQLVATHPGIARLLETLPQRGNGHPAETPAPPRLRRPRPPLRSTSSCSAASPRRWRS
jgi:2-oxoglutarate dehydrogenase complex dehydrogenase (E1) component-like enzyme